MGYSKKTTRTKYKVNISEYAIKNLEEITGYIAFINKQPLNAVKVGDALLSTIKKIKNNPFVFKECNDLQTNSNIYRQAKCYSWSIIYKIKGDEILILGIIHQSRKPFRKTP